MREVVGRRWEWGGWGDQEAPEESDCGCVQRVGGRGICCGLHVGGPSWTYPRSYVVWECVWVSYGGQTHHKGVAAIVV